MKIVQHYVGLICFSLQKQNVFKRTLTETLFWKVTCCPLFANGTTKSEGIKTHCKRIQVVEFKLNKSMDVSFKSHTMSLI